MLLVASWSNLLTTVCIKKFVFEGDGISRPTLDKLIAGDVTNKINFEKHMTKLLAFLSVTPNELLGGIDNPYNQARNLRDILHLNLEELSHKSGVSIENLKKIEAGENVPLADLRDVAMMLGTSVLGLLGNNYFQTTVNSFSYIINENAQTIRSVGGFWGYFGILLNGQSKYKWFPITAFTRNLICQNTDNEYMVVPCMDNSLLIINNKNIKEIALLDDCCDEPVDMDWDYNGSSGGIPKVIYEAFDDYYGYKECGIKLSDCNMSPEFAMMMNKFVASNNIDLDAFNHKLNSITVIYADGSVKEHGFTYYEDCEAFCDIRYLYETGNLLGNSMLSFEDDDELNFFVNMKNVSMIKLPLAKTEEYICRDLEECLEED